MTKAPDQNTPSPPPSTILLALVGAGALGMLGARFVGARSLVMPFILVASTSFVALGLHSGALRTWAGRLVLAGLACCWVGDMIGPKHFMLGLAAFLVAHLAYAGAFVCHGLVPRRALAGAATMAVTTAVVTAMLWRHVPAGERIPFAAYCAVISIMVAAAAGARPGLPLAFWAAALFYVSDICVARWRYVDSAIDGYVCYVLYYTACALFALTPRDAVRGLTGASVET